MFSFFFFNIIWHIYWGQVLISANFHIFAKNSLKLFSFFLITGELKQKDDKIQEVQNELIHLLETLAIITSTPTHFVEPQAMTIRERVKEIVHEIKEKSVVRFWDET